MQLAQIFTCFVSLALVPLAILARDDGGMPDLPPEQMEAYETLAQSYNTLMTTLDLGEEEDEDAKRYGEVSLRNLQDAIRQADAVHLPGSIAFEIGGFPRITFAEVKAKVAELSASVRGNVEEVKAADAAKRAPFAAVLSGDKLRIFDQEFGTSVVCFGRGGKTLYTPAEYAASALWAESASNDNVSPPRWIVTVYRFDGMRLLGSERKEGIGTAPASAFQ